MCGPCAVPLLLLLLLKIELLHVKQNSKPSKINSTGGVLVDLFNKTDFTASKPDFVGNKAKRQISKRMFQESKARQNFRKTNIFYLLIRARACAYQGVRKVCFSDILACFAFLKHPF